MAPSRHERNPAANTRAKPYEVPNRKDSLDALKPQNEDTDKENEAPQKQAPKKKGQSAHKEPEGEYPGDYLEIPLEESMAKSQSTRT